MDSLPFLHLDMQSLLVIRGEMYAWSGQMCLWCVGVEGFIGHFMEVPGPIRMKSAKHDVVNVLQHQLYWIMQIQVLHVLKHSQSCWTFFHKSCWYQIVKHQLDLQNQNTIRSPLKRTRIVEVLWSVEVPPAPKEAPARRDSKWHACWSVQAIGRWGPLWWRTSKLSCAAQLGTR